MSECAALMAHASGTRLGPYEIVAKLGEGGMGEVYRATDTRLKRDVAVKVLPEAFARDPERLARFQREAEVLAALNHPNIAHVYGLETLDEPDAPPTSFIAMELVEGEELGHRIARGALPLDEALPIARQIAEALEMAHETGIVHRDLKPGNVMITRDGVVKVLDFGLAKALTPDARAPGHPSMSPTLTAPTQMGVILGTAAYMSPEQAKGKAVDKRADIWAFGCVLYELLSGRRAFAGEDVSDTLAFVLTKEPAWEALPPSTPPVLLRLLRRCLDKDPKRRLRDIGEARVAIDEASSGATDATMSDARQLSARGFWSGPWALLASALVAVAIAIPATWRLKPTPDHPLQQFEILPPQGVSLGPMTDLQQLLSPDGRRLAFVGIKDGKRSLWLRPLDASGAVPLPGTEDADQPFWAPDSRRLGFFANGKLKKIDVAGGPPVTICDANGSQGAWNQEDVILFTEVDKPIQRVSAAGGLPAAVFALDTARGETLQRGSYFLPDGQRFIYGSVGREPGSMVGSLDGKTRRFLLPPGNSPAMFASDADGRGWILYTVSGRFFARPFDPDRAEFTGEAALIDDSVENGPRWSTSSNGILAFRRSRGAQTQLTWFDRAGNPLGRVGEVGNIQEPRISPDQKTVVFARTDGGNSHIWLMGLGSKTMSHFTLDPGADSHPLWSLDGAHVLYSSVRGNDRLLVERPVDGIGQETVVWRSEGRTPIPISLSTDGRWLSVTENAQANSRMLLVSRTDRTTSITLFDNRSAGGGVSISPDGRWMLSANRTARPIGEVLIQSLPKEAGGSPNATGMLQVSTAGGTQAAWRADGKEIFYVSRDGALMSVPVEPNGTALRLGPPRRLFQTRLITGTAFRNYDVTADGQRFLLNEPVADASDVPITVIVNWPKLLQR
jgi:serine/threonine protein kinase/Tol biopolymer transport system component